MSFLTEHPIAINSILNPSLKALRSFSEIKAAGTESIEVKLRTMSTTIGSDGYSLSIRFYKYERSKSKINMLNCCAMIAVANIAKGVSDLN